MIYEYHILHSEAARGDAANNETAALGREEILREYDHFGAAFERFFLSRPRFGATFKAAVPTDDGLRVSLDTELDAVSARNIVASFLADINRSVPGLCLVVHPSAG